MVFLISCTYIDGCDIHVYSALGRGDMERKTFERGEKMFSKKNLTVIDWWLFFLALAIPLVNFFVVIYVLLASDVNKTLKSFVWAIILPGLIIGGLVFLGLGLLSFPPMR